MSTFAVALFVMNLIGIICGIDNIRSAHALREPQTLNVIALMMCSIGLIWSATHLY